MAPPEVTTHLTHAAPTLLSLCAAWAAPLAAQRVPFDSCFDRQGRHIPVIVDNTIGWGGIATVQGDSAVILWNAKAAANASSPTQLFLFLHECAHHTLRHLTKRSSPRWEREADCWAIQLMTDGGMARGHHLALIAREQRNVRGDLLHLGGDALVQSLERCVAVRTDPVAWDSALTALAAASRDSFASVQGERIREAAQELYESTVDTPGTYDCEVVPHRAVRCTIFAARKDGAVTKRFEQIAKILRSWLPAHWTAAEQRPTEMIPHQLLAQDIATGTLIALTQTSQRRLYFQIQVAPVPL